MEERIVRELYPFFGFFRGLPLGENLKLRPLFLLRRSMNSSDPHGNPLSTFLLRISSFSGSSASANHFDQSFTSAMFRAHSPSSANIGSTLNPQCILLPLLQEILGQGDKKVEPKERPEESTSAIMDALLARNIQGQTIST